MNSPPSKQKASKAGGEIKFDNVHQVPPSSITIGNMRWNKTGSWRSARPGIDYDACIQCMRCWKACPDVSIYIQDERPVVNYTYCKGCGICARECPVDAIELIREVK